MAVSLLFLLKEADQEGSALALALALAQSILGTRTNEKLPYVFGLVSLVAKGGLV